MYRSRATVTHGVVTMSHGIATVSIQGAVRGSEEHPAGTFLSREKGHLLAKRHFFPRLRGGGQLDTLT